MIWTMLPLKPVLFLDVWQDVSKDDVLSLAAAFPQVAFVYTNPMWVHYPVLWTAPLGLDRMGRDVHRLDEDQAEPGRRDAGRCPCHRRGPGKSHIQTGGILPLRPARCPGIVPAGTSGGGRGFGGGMRPSASAMHA